MLLSALAQLSQMTWPVTFWRGTSRKNHRDKMPLLWP